MNALFSALNHSLECSLSRTAVSSRISVLSLLSPPPPPTPSLLYPCVRALSSPIARLASCMHMHIIQWRVATSAHHTSILPFKFFCLAVNLHACMVAFSCTRLSLSFCLPPRSPPHPPFFPCASYPVTASQRVLDCQHSHGTRSSCDCMSSTSCCWCRMHDV